MKYNIRYSCCSHVGKCRSMNQDNFFCDGKYMDDSGEQMMVPMSGTLPQGKPSIVGVFDGMGGEEYGEIAAFIAAKCAAETSIEEDPLDSLLKFCTKANQKICEYASENGVSAMGTTAALLAFTRDEIALCNIGDSKIFRVADKTLKQISVDHCGVAAYGVKPPLSQNLGISPSEMVIEPYVARGRYNDGDSYLICSDGLTDMVPAETITQILTETEFDACVSKLQEAALENGGRDNITIILCRVERQTAFSRLFRSKNAGEKKYDK